MTAADCELHYAEAQNHQATHQHQEAAACFADNNGQGGDAQAGIQLGIIEGNDPQVHHQYTAQHQYDHQVGGAHMFVPQDEGPQHYS